MSGAWNPSRWLNAPRGSFKPAPGVLVAPHLQLLRPVTGAHELNVWVADQLTLQIEVAVKFAPLEGDGAVAAPGTRPEATAPAEVHRFLRQARCAAKLGDPHLVQILEQGRVKGGIPFLVMELLEGMSLSQRLLSGSLALPEAQAVLHQVAGVLAKAHPLGLWHGSLCPDHLFSSEAAGALFLKIGNFGDVSSELWANDPMSKLAPDAPSRRQAYLSPEQLRHGSGSSAAADVWALGVTLYELLTTTLPFEAANSAALSVAICNAQFAPPSHYRADLPPAVDVWFARVFAQEQRARLLDPSELAREFVRALGHEVASSSAGPRVVEERTADAEGDGFDEGDERTIQWELPSEWDQPQVSSGPQGAQPPEPERILARPSASPPPLPDRPPSSRPPPPFPGYAPTLAFPAPRAPSFSALAQGAMLARPGVAGPATRPPAPPAPQVAPAAASGVRRGGARFGKRQGVLAGALLGGIGALLAWGLRSRPDNGDAAREASVSAETRSAPLVGGEAAEGRSQPAGSTTSRPPARAALHRNERTEDLPVILQTDELPRAPDEPADEEEEGTALPARAPANTAAKSDPRPTSSGHARPDPGVAHRATKSSSPALASATARRATSHRSPRHANTSADCNPPYFFDSNNIRRLKLECL